MSQRSGFHKPRPDVVASERGQVRIAGRSGIDVVFDGDAVRVDSEMLAGPMHVVLYTGGQTRVRPDRADEIHAFVREALEWEGFTVEVIE